MRIAKFSRAAALVAAAVVVAATGCSTKAENGSSGGGGSSGDVATDVGIEGKTISLGVLTDLTGAILDRTNLDMVDMTGAVGAILTSAITDERTTCPDGTAGPCK